MRSQRDSQIAGIYGCLGGMNLAERSPNDIADQHKVCHSNAHFDMSSLSSWSCRAPGIPLRAVACKLLSRYGYTVHLR
jgi:hypothetical protein